MEYNLQKILNYYVMHLNLFNFINQVYFNRKIKIKLKYVNQSIDKFSKTEVRV